MSRKPSYEAESTEGKACFVLTTAMFLGEILAALTAGPLTNLAQTSTAIITIACLFASAAVVITAFVKAPPCHLNNH